MLKNLKEDLHRSLDIADVIGRYTTLSKVGTTLKGKSPFTNEKTPSFIVSRDKGLYYCFSSHKGGDMFTFIQEMEGVDFKKSLSILAEIAGIDTNEYFYNKESSTSNDKISKMRETLEMSNKFFLTNKEEGLKYLLQRGLTKETIDKFEIGYSSNTAKLTEKIVDIELLKESGLVASADGGRTYERFKDRLIFPLRNEKDSIVGFAGRTLKENTNAAKYINSPQTELYDKSSFLYGLGIAKNSIKKNDYSILTEGYLDVILSHQNGFDMTIAVSGTAATRDHFNLLKRYSKNVLFAFDGDRAGIKSVYRSAKIALQEQMNVSVLSVMDGKDPADILLEGKDLWENIISNKTPLLEFLFKDVEKRSSDSHGKANLIHEEILPIVAVIPNGIIKESYLNEVSTYLKTSKDVIKKVMEANVLEKKIDSTHSRADNQLKHLHSLLNFLRKKDTLKCEDLEKMYKRIKDLCETDDDLSDIGVSFSTDLQEGEDFDSLIKKIKADAAFLSKRILRELLHKRQTRLVQDIEETKKAGNLEKLAILTQECKTIIMELQSLSKEL